MGIFSKSLKKNGGSKKKIIIDETIDIKKERDFLLNVLSNLGLLSTDRIRTVLKEGFDEELFSKLNINYDEDAYGYLKKYYGSHDLGYGSEKISTLKMKFNDICNTSIMQGLTKKEIVNRFIDITNKEIDNYISIIQTLDEQIRDIEDANKDKDVNTIVEFYIRKCKEKELGYTINLYNSVIEMATDLCTLEFGGYGEEEVNKFVDAARKMIEDDRNKDIITSQTLDKIKRELYNPKKNRYLADLNTLRKKIEMIEKSTYLSDMEKEQNKFKIITDFQQMNGHVFSVDKTISTLKSNLANLVYGGYGEIVIDKFNDYCLDIIEKAKEEGEFNNFEIIKKIQLKYDNLIKEYQVHLNKLNEDLDKATSESMKEDLIEDFQDLMGHPIDYKDRLKKYRDGLENLEYGGYRKEVIDELLGDAEEKMEMMASNDELSNALKQVRRKYRELLNEYNNDLELLKEEIEKVKNKKKDENAINKDIEILVMAFKSKYGHEIDYSDVVEANVHELQNLECGGYGKKVLDSYREYCDEVIDNNEDSKTIIKNIQSKYKELKKNYTENLKVFKEWKRLQLKSLSGSEKEELEKDLDTKITYMLSLSSEDLYDYYMEDDRKKKAEAYRHNYMAAFRYLAREEAKKKKNKSLYDKRLEELKSGKVIYSQKDIDEATKQLEMASLNNDKLDDEDRIISLIEYIDSTLFRQMLYVESSLNMRNN